MCTASVVMHLMGMTFSFVRVHISPRLVGTVVPDTSSPGDSYGLLVVSWVCLCTG